MSERDWAVVMVYLEGERKRERAARTRRKLHGDATGPVKGSLEMQGSDGGQVRSGTMPPRKRAPPRGLSAAAPRIAIARARAPEERNGAIPCATLARASRFDSALRSLLIGTGRSCFPPSFYKPSGCCQCSTYSHRSCLDCPAPLGCRNRGRSSYRRRRNCTRVLGTRLP